MADAIGKIKSTSSLRVGNSTRGVGVHWQAVTRILGEPIETWKRFGLHP